MICKILLTLLFIAVGIIHFLVKKLYLLKSKNKIYYNNYQSCLRALSESDPKLSQYLKEQELLKE